MKNIVTLIVCGAVSLLCGGALAATAFKDLHDFTGAPADGDTPYSDLVADSEGRLYGTTYYGGTGGAGTLYRITLPSTKTGPATIEILHSFQVAEGVTPVGGVLIGADGGLYGTTNAGGAHNGGTVYRVDPDTFDLTDLHDFNSGATPEDGSAPLSGLTAGPSGLLYGTTSEDGPLGAGTVFAISPQGDTVHYAVIYAFGATNDANHPIGGRLVSKGANLFGTTFFGGQFGAGTVFELTMAKSGKWHESGLYSFGTNINDPASPANGVILSKAGQLFGCSSAGDQEHGAVWAITPSKGGSPMTETIIYTFQPDPGAPFPNGSCGLTFEPSGRLIGTTNLGGTNSTGTVFTLTPGGGAWTLAVPFNFAPAADGGPVEPEAPVIGVADGFYVGTTPGGGVPNKGTIYRIKP